MVPHSSEGTIFEALMTNFQALAKGSKHLNYDDYAVVTVSPSLVPNPYLPSFRVFSYNISGLGSTTVGVVGEDEYLLMTKKERASRWKHLPYRHGNDGNNDRQCMGAGYRDSWRCKLRPWRSDSHAPSRQNTLWTPLGYAQVRHVSTSFISFGVNEEISITYLNLRNMMRKTDQSLSWNT